MDTKYLISFLLLVVMAFIAGWIWGSNKYPKIKVGYMDEYVYDSAWQKVQDEINKVYLDGGWTVYLPEGTYNTAPIGKKRTPPFRADLIFKGDTLFITKY